MKERNGSGESSFHTRLKSSSFVPAYCENWTFFPIHGYLKFRWFSSKHFRWEKVPSWYGNGNFFLFGFVFFVVVLWLSRYKVRDSLAAVVRLFDSISFALFHRSWIPGRTKKEEMYKKIESGSWMQPDVLINPWQSLCLLHIYNSPSFFTPILLKLWRSSEKYFQFSAIMMWRRLSERNSHA